MDAKREGREEGIREGLKEGQRAAKSDGIKTLISTLQELNIEPVVIKQKVSEKYHLTEQEVEKFFK